MIYISAQPDSTYFVWQLEIQFRNFRSLSIPRDNVHVLIGYDNELGLKEEIKTFISSNQAYAIGT